MGIYQPNTEYTDFWLTGEFANIWQLMVPENCTDPPLLALETYTRSFCSMPHLQQQTLLDARKPVKTAEPLLACWLGAWSYAYLVRGLKFSPESQKLHVETHGSRDWPQGAAFYHVNQYAYRVLLGKEAEKFKSEEAEHDWNGAKKEQAARRKFLKQEAKWYHKYEKSEQKLEKDRADQQKYKIKWEQYRDRIDDEFSAEAWTATDVDPELLLCAALALAILFASLAIRRRTNFISASEPLLVT